MKFKLLNSAFIILLQFFLLGCQQKVEPVLKQPNTVATGQNPTTEQVQKEVVNDSKPRLPSLPKTSPTSNTSYKVVLDFPTGSSFVSNKVILMYLDQPGSSTISPNDEPISINLKSSYYVSILPENFSELEYPDISTYTSKEFGDNEPHYHNGIFCYVDKESNELKINSQNIALGTIMIEESATLTASSLKAALAKNILAHPMFPQYKTLIETKLISEPKALAGRFMKPFPMDEIEMGSTIYQDSISKVVSEM